VSRAGVGRVALGRGDGGADLLHAGHRGGERQRQPQRHRAAGGQRAVEPADQRAEHAGEAVAGLDRADGHALGEHRLQREAAGGGRVPVLRTVRVQVAV
jgi:hypothetical protein